MARFISRRLLLVARHAVAARHDRVRHHQRPAERRRADDPRARSRRRRASTRSTQQLGRTGRSSSSTSTRCVGVVTLDFGESFVTGQPVLPQLLGGDRPLGEAGRARPAASRSRSAIVAGLYAARRRDQPGGPRRSSCSGVTSSSIPEFVTGTILVVVVGVQLELLPVLATPPPERRHPDPDPLPADARDGDGDRLLRVHRADDPGRARSRSSSPTTRGPRP